MSKKRNKHYDKLKNPDYKLDTEQFAELNKQFYDGFLDDFYGIKVVNLLSLITNKENVVDNLMQQSIEIDKLKIDLTKENINSDSIVKYAKVELAMCYYHCLETFIRLFVAHAKFSGCPWLDLARLTLSKYKDELEKIRGGEFGHLNTKLSEDETILYVFTGITKPKGNITKEFIEGYKKWLSFAANELLETYDYNSFKHGLAVSPTQNGVRFGRPDGKFMIEAHGEVIEHLTRMKDRERIIWGKQTNLVSYDKKATFILVLEKLMSSIINVGRNGYLKEQRKFIVFAAHKFLPKDIDNEENQIIQVESFKRGLRYYE